MDSFPVFLSLPQDFQSVADGRKGVTKFVGQHCQELVLATVFLSEGLLGLFAFSDVTSDFRSAHNLAAVIDDRGDRQRHIYQRTVFAAAHCFVMIDGFPPTDAFDNGRFLVESLWRN